MSVTAGVSHHHHVSDKVRGKIGQTKVKRYWPGKAPEWADDELLDIKNPSSSSSSSFSLEKAFPSHHDDRRLRLLAESRSERLDEVRADHRRIRQAEIVSIIEEEEEKNQRLDLEDNDEDALEERRKRIRETMLQKEKEQEQEEVELEEEDEEEDESEYEYETETDSEEEEEQTGISAMVFTPKSHQYTIAERERLEEKERMLEQHVEKRLQERKLETKQIVVELIRKDEEIRRKKNHLKTTDANLANIDTDDELDQAEQYEAWKAREIARLKEKEEIDKVRNMTKEERREWERRNPKPPQSAPKRKRRFMQKYYHKGAFFQSEKDGRAATAGSDDDIYRRDFSEPTGEDKMDRTILPKVMQVKRFGRRGRAKWTHQVNEDTTDWNYKPWTANGRLRAKYNTKMAGLNAPIEKPKGSKKLKDWGTS